MVLNEMSKQHTYGQGAFFFWLQGVSGHFRRNWIGIISHITLLVPYLYLLLSIFHLQSLPCFLLMGWDEASTSKRQQATVTGLWQGSVKLMFLIFVLRLNGRRYRGFEGAGEMRMRGVLAVKA